MTIYWAVLLIKMHGDAKALDEQEEKHPCVAASLTLLAAQPPLYFRTFPVHASPC